MSVSIVFCVIYLHLSALKMFCNAQTIGRKTIITTKECCLDFLAQTTSNTGRRKTLQERKDLIY